jgi:hypothetical protein
VRRIDKNPIVGNTRMLHRAFWFARIRVDIEMREVAARDVETQLVAAAEQVAYREQFDRDRIHLARHHQRRLLPAVSITAAKDAFGQVHCKTLWVILVGRMYIDQLCREIRIGAVGGDPQLDRDGSGELQVAIERRCRENHDIGTLGERSERLARWS